MYSRNITSKLRAALKDTPAIVLCGARQTGKSTLAQSLISSTWKADYISFDELGALSAAKGDPSGFIEGLELPVIIDEVQRAPEIFLPIKRVIDRNREPGHFFLTGSSNVLFLPKLSESLAGRVEIHTLWPLSQQEIGSRKKDIISMFFKGEVPRNFVPLKKNELINLLVRGGYPEPIGRKGARSLDWYSSYLTTILERDIRDIADIDGITKLPRLVALLASRSATLLNLSDISKSVDIPYATLHRYMALLQATYIIVSIPAWTSNIGLRFVKSPKIVINDTGLLCGTLGFGSDRFAKDPNLLGGVLESFVGMELKKLLGQSDTRAGIFHFRSHDRKEIDFILERNDGQIVLIEVKSSGAVKAGDLTEMKKLSVVLGKRFSAGIILYAGDVVVPFGKNLLAAPISVLWA